MSEVQKPTTLKLVLLGDVEVGDKQVPAAKSYCILTTSGQVAILGL